MTGDTAEVAGVVRVLSIGMCSPARHAEVGCDTCDAKVRAIATVRAMAAELATMRQRAWDAEGALTVRLAVRREIEEALGMVPGLTDDQALQRALDAIRALRSRPPDEHAPHEQAVLVEEHRGAVDDEQREAQGGPGGDEVG